MKFTCPKCSTRYSITDDKVPAGKTLRFTCKRCDNIIRLRRKKKKAAAPQPEPLQSAPDASTIVAPLAELERLMQQTAEADPLGDLDGLGASTRVLPLKELNALRANSLTEAAPASAPASTRAAPAAPLQPMQAASTRVAPVEELERLRRDTRPLPVEPEPVGMAMTEEVELETPNLPFATADDWYVLVAGKQRGPLEQATILKMLRENEIDGRSYAWRDGMGDWVRLGDLPEFKEAADSAGDAAWRVVRPKLDAATDEIPVQSPAEEHDDGDGIVDIATAAMNHDQLRAELDRAEINRAMAAVEGGLPPEDMPTRIEDVAVAAAIAAVTAAKDGSSKHTRPRGTDELGAAPFSDDSSAPTVDEFSFSGDEPNPLLGLEHQSGEFDGLATEQRARDSGPMAYEDFDRDPAYGDVDYVDRPPGENTRVYLAAGGLYRRRRINRIAAVAGGILALLLVTTISLDITGALTIPGMGAFYEKTGWVDPNPDRALERTTKALKSTNISPEQRDELRKRLLGLGGSAKKDGPRKSNGGGRRTKGTSAKAAEGTVGIEEGRDMSAKERDLVSDIFASKKETKVKLARPSDIQTPNLPEGLTQEAIFKVINESSRSMNLCYAQSMRAGEKVGGRMDVELTIGPTGSVSEARIETAQFQGSTFGNCTVKTIKRWRFPRFNGEPVTVIFPYMLSTGI